MAEPVAGARSVSRSAAGMGVAAGASRVIGFARVLAIAAILGTTYLGNTFTSSNYVSNVLFELLAAGALSAVLVPTLVDLLDRSEEPEAERLAGSVLGIALIVLGAVTVVGVVAAPWLAHLLASGVSDPSIAAQQESLATFLLRFFVPQVLLYAVGTVAIAVLYARRRFVVTAIAPIGNTVLIVAGLVIFRVLAGDDTGLDLTLAEKLTLALSGTLGVAAFARSLRWALDAMAMLIVPVSAAMIALARPGMTVFAFGEAAENGVALLAAGVASLAIGLFAYSVFLTLARAYYALGDSRTPAVVALITGIGGVVAMGVGVLLTEGAARVAALGIGHTIAYTAGALVLGVGLSRRTGHAIVPRALPRAVALSVVIGGAGWWVASVLDPSGRLANAVMCTGIVAVGGALYLLGVRVTGGHMERRRVEEPDVPDLEPDSAEVEA